MTIESLRPEFAALVSAERLWPRSRNPANPQRPDAHIERRMKELKEETSTQKLYWDSENEIVWGELFANVLTEEAAREDVDAQERLRDSIGRAKTRVLIDMSQVTEIRKEARDYFANERTASVQRATALLITSPVGRVIGNFFMGLNKPVSPTRLFTDPQKAIQWLHTFGDD